MWPYFRLSVTSSASIRTWSIPVLTAAVLLIGGGPARSDAVSSISSNFNGTAIPGGDSIWFNSVFKLNNAPATPFTIYIKDSSVQFTANGTNYNLSVPNAAITFDNSLTQATTTFDAATNTWITKTPKGTAGNVFLDGLGFHVPAGGLPGGVKPVTWQAAFSASNAGVSLNWQWGAAVYSQFGTDYNALGVKPVDDNHASQYQNSDHAGTPETFKTFVVGGATGGGGSNFTGSYSGTASVCLPVSSVPEPTSLVLLALGGAACFGGWSVRRFRHFVNPC